jgi:hypothetical protein
LKPSPLIDCAKAFRERRRRPTPHDVALTIVAAATILEAGGDVAARDRRVLGNLAMVASI